MKKNVKSFHDVQIKLDHGMVRCMDHTCFISAVSQIYIGNSYDGWFPTGEEEEKDLILELVSGMSCVFLSGDRDFTSQAYEFLCRYVMAADEEQVWIIDFENSSIYVEGMHDKIPEEEAAEEEPEIPEEPALLPLPVPDISVKEELTRLMDCIQTGKREGMEYLPLLSAIIEARENGSEIELNQLYQEFVGHSLIQVCNELGLSHLIAELKSRIF